MPQRTHSGSSEFRFGCAAIFPIDTRQRARGALIEHLYFPVRDIDVYFDRAGAGPPLLAISGSRGDLRRKPNLLGSPLANAFDVLAYDQRGLGRSSKPNKAYSIVDYADDAAALLDAVGWDRVRVIGVSFGGMVALELVLRHPDRVSNLALCCTSPGGEGGSSYPHHMLQDLPVDERARVMVSISDTRCDAGWAADNPVKLEELIKGFTDDPFAGEPGHQSGICRLLEARLSMIPGSALPISGVQFLHVADCTTGSPYRRHSSAWREESRGLRCACSRVAINFSGRIAPHSPRSSGFFLQNEKTVPAGRVERWFEKGRSTAAGMRRRG
jgi:3-oxoadipate enol-lactonase